MQLLIQKHAIASVERVSERFGHEQCDIVIINIFKVHVCGL